MACLLLLHAPPQVVGHRQELSASPALCASGPPQLLHLLLVSCEGVCCGAPPGCLPPLQLQQASSDQSRRTAGLPRSAGRCGHSCSRAPSTSREPVTVYATGKGSPNELWDIFKTCIALDWEHIWQTYVRAFSSVPNSAHRSLVSSCPTFCSDAAELMSAHLSSKPCDALSQA